MIDPNSSLFESLSGVLRNYLADFDVQEYAIHKHAQGHIHHSYVVVHKNAPCFFLQKINSEVFPNPELVTSNHKRIYDYINKVENGIISLAKPVSIVNSDDWYYWDDQGYAWRLVHYYTTHHSHQTCPTQQTAAQAGLAFGAYSKMLNTASVHREPLNLQPTIAKFHSIAWRLEQYQQAQSYYSGPTRIPYEPSLRLKNNPRFFDLIDLDAIVQKYSQMFLTMEAELAASHVQNPRLAHNDTKLNNVLLSTENEPPIIIDLDTTMPGSILFDLGDGLRTIGLSEAEDQVDLTLLHLNIDYYTAFRTAFMHQVKSLLSPTEHAYVSLAGPYMAYIMGLRFLTDFLNGNTYYAVQYPTHNLIRSRNQFHLLHLMMEEANG